MVQFRRTVPPPIKEIITPPEYLADYDMVERVINEKMMRSYVTILLIASLLLTILVIA